MGCTDMKPAGLRSEPVSPLHNLFTERHPYDQTVKCTSLCAGNILWVTILWKKKKERENPDPSKERLFDYLSGSAIIICTDYYYYSLLL